MHFDTLIINAHIATMNNEFGYGNNTPYGTITDAAMAIQDGKIVWLGKTVNLPKHTADNVIDVTGQWLTPALIDCHTHLVYAGNRSNEFEMRLNGVSYEEVARQGGGIVSTVKATREASFDELYQASVPRLKDLISQGVTTIEIKSGYGLDLDSERKMLAVAKKLGEDFGITVRKTYLAAHATPPEYKGQNDAYIDKVCEWLPILHAEGLVDAVDAFCENIAFNLEQVSKVFNVAKSLGLPVKLHAEQLSDMGGSGLVASFDGLSADHIEYLSMKDIDKMAKSGTVGVLLPTAFYTLRETKLPPIQAMRDAGVNMAVSTDCNPGTSPSTSLLLAMNMACTLFRLTPEESLAGTTLHAAQALGLSEHKGKIAVGYDADIALWNITRPADLCYLIGQSVLAQVWHQGQVVLKN
ncbi:MULTISPECIES: imidazolonepropionase [unclassified Acinetobacter]|uniref:imidazolonepropionase n=1 Tax=unclassified Acinetobacter TaxID=196816 RepID=UPI0035B9EDDD